MSNRDTLIPVCKVVGIASGTTGGVHLANTAVEITNVEVFDEQHNKQTAGASGLAEGNQTFFVSGNAGGTITSGSVVVRVQGGRVVNATVKNGGAYTGIDTAFGLIDNHDDGINSYSLGVNLTASPAIADVPYVTVTDLSGQSGWFRVQPGLSGTSNLYANPSATVGATLGGNPIRMPDSSVYDYTASNVFGDVSGSPGIVGSAGTTVTLTLPRGIDRITIQNNTETASSGVFAVNYGVVKQGNVVLDNSTRDVT
tara:strand:+ start:6051 stop:6815 length:765 start_codon:yes stop_codon:yes gene_type:complete